MRHKLIAGIFAILVLFPVAGAFMKNMGISNNNQTTEFPVPTISKVVQGNYSNEVEEYWKQTITGKDWLLGLKTKAMILIGQKEINGVYLSGTRLLEIPELPSNQVVNSMKDYINDFSTQFNGQSYMMLLPSSAELYKEQIPSYVSKEDEVKFINSMYAKMDSSITCLDSITPLTAAKTEQIYYNTQDGLTSLGAYTVYSYIARSLGLVTTNLSDYSIEHASDSFRGDLYQKTRYDDVALDNIDLYHYTKKDLQIQVTEMNGGSAFTQNSIYYPEYLQTSNQTDVFLKGNSAPITDIITNNTEGKKMLIFGDENAGPLVQFYLSHCEQITVVNLNAWNSSYQDCIDLDSYDNALFFYSVNSLQESSQFAKLKQFFE